MALKPLCMLHLAVAATVIALLAMFSACHESTPDEQIMADKHKKWMSKFNRTYKDEVEKATRFKVFRENADYIEAFNQQAAGANKTYTLGLNKFSDLTNQEFLTLYSTGYKSGRRSTMKTFKYAEATNIPNSIDWRDWKKRAVTLVKDQGQCGCCWVFAAIGAVEGFYKIKTGALIMWSEQELLDCDRGGPVRKEDQQGCNGGSILAAFQYITDQKGVMTTGTDYTYQEIQNASCRSAMFRSYKVYIDSYETVPENNERALMAAVAKQPVAVGIDARNFQHYRKGIFTGPCGTDLTHAVTVVGYGVDSRGTKYWLLKNSWGYGWGEDGYMKLQKDVAAAHGLCGVAMQASYPTANH